VEHHVGMRLVKSSESRRDYFLRCHAQRVDAQDSCSSGRRADCLRDGVIHLTEHRRESLMKTSPRLGRRETPSRAIEQANTQARFKLTNDLAERRPGYAEMIGGARKARPIDDCHERLQLREFETAHC